MSQSRTQQAPPRVDQPSVDRPAEFDAQQALSCPTCGPQAQRVLIAVGGYRRGQVIGSTDAKAAFPASRPIGVEDFCAIVYHALVLQPNDTVIDQAGWPMHLLSGGSVPRELL